MTRYARLLHAIAALLLVSLAAPLAAQSDGVTAEDAIDQSRRAYGPPKPRVECDENGTDEEIVVCAQEEQDDSQFRVKSSTELDPDSREAQNDGLPRAPDVAGDGIFKGKGTIAGLCVLGGCPPPPAYIFDISELPEAPEGSDADRISEGKAPAD